MNTFYIKDKFNRKTYLEIVKEVGSANLMDEDKFISKCSCLIVSNGIVSGYKVLHSALSTGKAERLFLRYEKNIDSWWEVSFGNSLI